MDGGHAGHPSDSSAKHDGTSPGHDGAKVGCTSSSECASGSTCTEGVCVACTPTTCTAAGDNCGSISDLCGGTLTCGSCTVPETCTSNVCTVPCGILAAPSNLEPGQTLVSCDGRFTLIEQATDGNLVVYFNGAALWNASTSGYPGAFTAMQTDGNFGVYSSASVARWNANTAGNPCAYLAMQTDGNLVVYSSSGVALWSSGTGGH
jgi:hypothetical protein